MSDEADVKFSTRVLPWMKLGTVIDEPVSPVEAIRLADLDWEVHKHPIRTQVGNDWVEVPDRYATVRDSDGKILEVVGGTYETYQNREAFEFLEPLTDDGSIRIHAAGQLRGGRQVFMVAEVPDALEVLDDPLDLHLVIRTGHDGTKAVQVMMMPLRGMCMNQLALPSFSGNARQRWSVAHTSTLRERLAEAQSTLVGADAYAAEFRRTAERLAATKIELDELEDLLKVALPDRPQRPDAIAKITGLFTGSETIQDRFRGTGWAAVNAVTEYFDWYRSGSTDEGRFHGALDGVPDRIRSRTTALLLAR